MESISNIENIVRWIVQSYNNGPPSDHQNRGKNASSEAQAAVQDPQTQELHQRFNIPRTAVQCVPPAITPRFTSASVVTQQFNPQNNYGYTGRGRAAQRERTVSSSPYNLSKGRSCGKGTKSSSRARVEPPTLKEVILLPKPSINSVPKYSAKVDLHK